jgi:hypothetical protein
MMQKTVETVVRLLHAGKGSAMHAMHEFADHAGDALFCMRAWLLLLLTAVMCTSATVTAHKLVAMALRMTPLQQYISVGKAFH